MLIREIIRVRIFVFIFQSLQNEIIRSSTNKNFHRKFGDRFVYAWQRSGIDLGKKIDGNILEHRLC